MNEKEYDQAVVSFTKAEGTIPEIIDKVAFADLLRIYTKKGIALHNQGLVLWKEEGALAKVAELYQKSRTSLIKADEIDSEIYISTYWLAQTENALEVLSPYISPKTDIKYNAGPLYEKAIALRPNGVSVHYAYIRYLNNKGEKERIPELAEYMTEINPQAYFQLKKESFFSDALMDNLKNGLLSALKNEISPRQALQALADIEVKKKQFDNAIAHYNKSLEIRPFSNSYGNYIYLGQLYLKNGDFEESIPWFIKGLKAADNFDSAINRIYHTHKKENALDEFIRFSIQVEEKIAHSPSLDIKIASAWIGLKKPQLARARLLRINTKKPHAPAYYLLAKLAEKEKNWSLMETNIQKATTLDKENANYYHMFSRALRNQKKYASAEEVDNKAIKYSKNENHWYFNQRAWNRWSLQKYMKAATDWKRAFSIKPDRSEFPYWIARSYERNGGYKESIKYTQLAIKLEPDNKKYNDLKKKLEAYK